MFGYFKSGASKSIEFLKSKSSVAVVLGGAIVIGGLYYYFRKKQDRSQGDSLPPKSPPKTKMDDSDDNASKWINQERLTNVQKESDSTHKEGHIELVIENPLYPSEPRLHNLELEAKEEQVTKDVSGILIDRIDSNIENAQYVSEDKSHVPIQRQVDALESIVSNPHQLPQKVDEVPTIKEVIEIKQEYNADKIISKSLHNFGVTDNDVIFAKSIGAKIKSKCHTKKSLLSINTDISIKNDVITHLEEYDSNVEYLSTEALRRHLKEVGYIKFDYEGLRWNSEASYISSDSSSECYIYNFNFGGNMPRHDYTEDQANRRLDSFAYIIHEAVQKVANDEKRQKGSELIELKKVQNQKIDVDEILENLEGSVVVEEGRKTAAENSIAHFTKLSKKKDKMQKANITKLEEQEAELKSIESELLRINQEIAYYEHLRGSKENPEALQGEIERMTQEQDEIKKAIQDQSSAKCIAVFEDKDKDQILIGVNTKSNVGYVQRAVNDVLNAIRAKLMNEEIKKLSVENTLVMDYAIIQALREVTRESTGQTSQSSSSHTPFSKSHKSRGSGNTEEKKKSGGHQQKVTSKHPSTSSKKSGDTIESKVDARLDKAIKKFTHYILQSKQGEWMYETISNNQINRFDIVNQPPIQNSLDGDWHAEVNIVDNLPPADTTSKLVQEIYIGNNKKACPGCDISMQILNSQDPFHHVSYRGSHKDFNGIVDMLSKNILYTQPNFINLYQLRSLSLQKALLKNACNHVNGNHVPTPSSSPAPYSYQEPSSEQSRSSTSSKKGQQHQKEGSQHKAQLAISTTNKEALDVNSWYDHNHINDLLRYHLPHTSDYVVIAPLLLNNVGNFNGAMSQAIQQAVAETIMGQIVVMPMNLNLNHWIGVVMWQEEGNLRVFYNDPLGNRLEGHNVATEIVQLLTQYTNEFYNQHGTVDFYDAQIQQQTNYNDCGAFTTQNGIIIATSRAYFITLFFLYIQNMPMGNRVISR